MFIGTYIYVHVCTQKSKLSPGRGLSINVVILKSSPLTGRVDKAWTNVARREPFERWGLSDDNRVKTCTIVLSDCVYCVRRERSSVYDIFAAILSVQTREVYRYGLIDCHLLRNLCSWFSSALSGKRIKSRFELRAGEPSCGAVNARILYTLLRSSHSSRVEIISRSAGKTLKGPRLTRWRSTIPER